MCMAAQDSVPYPVVGFVSPWLKYGEAFWYFTIPKLLNSKERKEYSLFLGERTGKTTMSRLFFVIVGCLEIGIERCSKRLCEGQWYSWKSLFEKPLEAVFKENSWSFDLRHSGLLSIDSVPSLFLGCYYRWWQNQCVSRSVKIFIDYRDFPLVPLPVSSGLSLSIVGR